MVVISVLNILIYLPLDYVLFFVLSSGLCLSLLTSKMGISNLISWNSQSAGVTNAPDIW